MIYQEPLRTLSTIYSMSFFYQFNRSADEVTRNILFEEGVNRGKYSRESKKKQQMKQQNFLGKTKNYLIKYQEPKNY